MALGASGGHQHQHHQQQHQHQQQPSLLQPHQQEQQHHPMEEEGDLPAALANAPLPTRSLAALSVLPSSSMDDGSGTGDETEALALALAGYCSVPGGRGGEGSGGSTSDGGLADGLAEGEGEGEGGELLPPQRIQQQQDEAVKHLNAVLMAVQRWRRLEEVVGAMGPYLTSEDGKVRGKAATLLGEILNRLPTLPLAPPAVRHYVGFFTARLADLPSLPGALLALRALLQHHGAAAREEAAAIARALFKEAHVPSMTQAVRQRAFEVLLELVSPSSSPEGGGVTATAAPPPSSLAEMGTDFLRGVLDCMEGEKDPRCLILCLRVLGTTQRLFPAAADELAEQCFDVTACYFPITFTPPPNDPFGITPEMLSQALRATLTARPAMAALVLPLLVGKLSSSHVPAKMEALSTMQLAPRAYGLPALRPQLPPIAAALFHEVSVCPEPAVVTQALETARILAACLSSSVHGDGDWQAVVVRGWVLKAVGEVKTSPDSMLGRACARLLGAIARASPRAHSAVLQHAVPVALRLISPPPPPTPTPLMGLMAPPPAALEQESSESARLAALGLLVDLIEAVDPSLDLTGLQDGPPLLPFVPPIHTALLQCLAAPAPAPARLAVQGLTSLATRSPSELLAPAQAQALVSLFTARLRAEERTVGDAYDPELARALLLGLQTLSRRRGEHTAAVLGHTLPELLRWMDEAAAAGGGQQQEQHGLIKTQGGGKEEGEEGGVASSSLELERCLKALTVLAEQEAVFRAVVPALLARVLLPPVPSDPPAGDGPCPRKLREGDGTSPILLALAQIFAATSAANALAVPALLALGGSSKLREQKEEEEAMEVDGEIGGETACLWSLFVAVLSAAAHGQALNPGALEATLRVFAAATVALPPALQEALVGRLLRLLMVSPTAENEGMVMIAGLRPLDSDAYPAQHQALSLLLTVLASVDVRSSSKALEVGGVTDALLPALVRLALEAPPSFSTTEGEESASGGVTALALADPACWGAALLVNKAGDEAAVGKAVAALLQGFQQGLLSPSAERAKRDVTSLAWLTKALAMRGSPRAAMEEAVALLVDVAGLQLQGQVEREGYGEEGDPSLALALHAAESLGWMLEDGCPILAPRPGLTRLNPLWRQRLFHLAFPRLRAALGTRHRGSGASKRAAAAAPLLAMCHLISGSPRAVVRSEVEGVVAVVVQALSAQGGPPALAARATETLAGLAKRDDTVEALIPHLSTLVPLLYKLCTPSHPRFLPKARLRVLALEALLALTRLPYAKLHPYRAQVSRGLLAPLDDKKRLVRQMAVRVRNEWMVMDR